MKLHTFMSPGGLCGDEFAGPSCAVHHIIARLYDGDAALLTPDKQAIARELTGLDELPSEAPSEFYIGAGRRSGKTRLVSVIAMHAAAQDYSDRLAPGEMAVLPASRPTVARLGRC